jgi:hypothetical protein
MQSWNFKKIYNLRNKKTINPPKDPKDDMLMQEHKLTALEDLWLLKVKGKFY